MPHRWVLVHPPHASQWRTSDDYWECQNCHAGFAAWKTSGEPVPDALISIPSGTEDFFAKKKPHLLHSKCYLVLNPETSGVKGALENAPLGREYLTCEEFTVKLVYRL